ncbi:hypothetical protein BGZ98_008569, partial [Dissophora globulifera]
KLRYKHAEYNVKASKQLGKALMGQTLFEEFFRKVTLNYIPKFVIRKMLDRNGVYRPQSTILPQVPVRGIVKAIPQSPSWQAASSMASTSSASSLRSVTALTRKRLRSATSSSSATGSKSTVSV